MERFFRKSADLILSILRTVPVVMLFSVCCLPAVAQETISFSGITEPIADVQLSMEVNGKIAKIFFKEGEPVKKDQIILELVKKIESFEVDRRKVIWESKAELSSAGERVKTLASILKTSRMLFEKTKSVSKEELDKLELEYKLAVAEQEKMSVQEDLEAIEYQMAKENLEKRILRAPISGYVIDLQLDEGESCEINQPIVRIADTRRCYFVSNVEENVGRMLKNGHQVTLSIRTGSKNIIKQGKVVFVSPIVDSASGLMEIKTEFENSDGQVYPGVSGTMELGLP